jgi:hypothetical protein
MLTREARKDQLRVAAIGIIGKSKFKGEAHYLRMALRREHNISLSSHCLRVWMQELADEGHFVRSKYANGGQGYTWSLPDD